MSKKDRSHPEYVVDVLVAVDMAATPDLAQTVRGRAAEHAEGRSFPHGQLRRALIDHFHDLLPSLLLEPPMGW